MPRRPRFVPLSWSRLHKRPHNPFRLLAPSLRIPLSRCRPSLFYCMVVCAAIPMDRLTKSLKARLLAVWRRFLPSRPRFGPSLARSPHTSPLNEYQGFDVCTNSHTFAHPATQWPQLFSLLSAHSKAFSGFAHATTH